ncbi:MAG: nucleotidyltransferase substrate binding protein, partial [Candidatus Staskawiczbacteria bacterium]|nr:nucleotidyltransferase substrate binding protein [Candidatus Staskawiczbacteria bacterium]
QRFEYTLDTCWKALKVILLDKYGIEANSPKEVIRAAFKVGLIANNPLWIQMIDDRNMTAHIYNENMANKIVSQFNSYDQLFLELIKKIH